MRRAFAGMPGQRKRATRAALNSHLRHALATSGLAELPPEVLEAPGAWVDAGAGVGNWSVAVLDLVAPKRLVAVEPSPPALAHLKTALGYHDEVRVSGGPLETLDEILAGEGRVALLRIDAPGREAGVLAGAAATLTRTDAVMIEGGETVAARLGEQGFFAFAPGLYLRSGREYGTPPASFM